MQVMQVMLVASYAGYAGDAGCCYVGSAGYWLCRRSHGHVLVAAQGHR